MKDGDELAGLHLGAPFWRSLPHTLLVPETPFKVQVPGSCELELQNQSMPEEGC